MCRILGIAYGPNREDLDTGEIAALLFPALTAGGPHAYGWMSFNETELDEPITWEKHVGRADTEEAWHNILEGVDGKCKWFVGHTRFATHGDPKDLRNDHPIPHGNIIGVHNGVLRNHDRILAITGREDPKTKVDSEAIFAAVNKWGPTKGLGKIEGDLVSIYTDVRKPHVLHFARTHGRQLSIGWTDRGNMIFASTEAALHVLEPDIKFVHFSTISENRLLVIRNGQIIQRHRFGRTRPLLSSPGGTIAPWRPPVGSVLERRGSPLMSTIDREIAAHRASKRGAILFPEGEPKPKAKKNPKRAPNQNTKLMYWNGQLLTRKEYEEAIATED